MHFLQNEYRNSEPSLPLRGGIAYSPELVEGDEAIRHRSVVLSPFFNGTNVSGRGGSLIISYFVFVCYLMLVICDFPSRVWLSDRHYGKIYWTKN